MRKTNSNFDRTLFSAVFFITLIGFGIRVAAPLQANFPLNDGGLFYAMIVDLRDAHYLLPAYVAYNATQIPFAYPPLAFYFTGLLGDLLNIATLDLVRLLPAFISGLTILAFYLLAREITNSRPQIIFAVFAFAMLPRDFAWLIMGGGITRSFGLLFALLTMTFAYRFYNGQERRHLLGCILLGALTVVTHPEATVHTTVTALVFYLWGDRSRKGLLLSLGMAAGILALTAPWWGLVISRHGVDPYLAAMNASGQDSFNPLVGIIVFIRFMFTEESFLPILAVLGLVGFFASLARKQTLLPAWMFFLHLAEPRGGPLYMMIPLALLIGYSLDRVILSALSGNSADKPMQDRKGWFHFGIIANSFLIFLFFYSALSALSTSLDIKNQISLQSTDLGAFTWVRDNTPVNSKFILITGQNQLRDAWSEWFPVITKRRSQATLFGYEWINDRNFGGRVDAYNTLQACGEQDASCLDEWSIQNGEPFTYIYFHNQPDNGPYPLNIYLEQNATYERVYQNEQTVIFQKTR